MKLAINPQSTQSPPSNPTNAVPGNTKISTPIRPMPMSTSPISHHSASPRIEGAPTSSSSAHAAIAPGILSPGCSVSITSATTKIAMSKMRIGHETSQRTTDSVQLSGKRTSSFAPKNTCNSASSFTSALASPHRNASSDCTTSKRVSSSMSSTMRHAPMSASVSV